MRRADIMAIVITAVIIVGFLKFTRRSLPFYSYSLRERVEIVDLERPLRNSTNLVPNIVHFIRFGNNPISFIEAVCMLAALKHQNPSVLMLHSDRPDFNGGKYWKTVKAVGGGKITVVYRKRPTHVFGQPLSERWINYHAGDVARLEVLMEFGGIYLDNDCYIVKSLDEYRRYEMTVSLPKLKSYLQNQVLIAHKDARFLRLWLEAYQDYNAENWNYNAQRRPAEILFEHPNLANRVMEDLLPPKWLEVFPMIYEEKSDAWRHFHAIHLFIRHQDNIRKKKLSEVAKYPVDFDDKNILNYDVNIRDMAMEVWPKPSSDHQN